MKSWPDPPVPDGPHTPVHPLVAVGVVVLFAGLLAWVWLGEWRWAVTGAALLVVLAVAAATRRG